MAKINKVYPSFFNGVSQQSPELILDNQCKEMVNCVPSIVEGLTKRPPITYITRRDFASYPFMETASVFHTYDRGEDDEEYIMVSTPDFTGFPVLIYNKAGELQTVEYNTENETAIKNYLANGDLKGLTVQDRTWIFSKATNVTLDTSVTAPLKENYEREAYYWIKRGSGDKYNPFNYAVYLDGITYACNPDKPSGSDSDPATGFEDSDYAATELTNIINAESHNSRFYAQNIGSIIKIVKGSLSSRDDSGNGSITAYDEGYSKIYIADDELGTNEQFYSMADGVERLEAQMRVAQGSLIYTSGGWVGLADLTPTDQGEYNEYTFIGINYYNDVNENYHNSVTHDIQEWHNDHDFTFSSWDSWGNQASEGWKGSVNKISDLPKDMPFTDVFVEIVGDEGTTFTDYFVKWNGSSWEECLDPTADRGQLTNMPVKLDRTSLVDGVATFTFDLVDWSLPRVGNLENNPDPSFVDRKIQDLFFYKNRLGIASEDSVSLTESANYTNFYATTTLDVVDTDAIDITISATQASKIYFTKPFNNSLYIFTKYSQYELTSEGVFGPSTVSLSNTTNYPMAVDVEPVVVNDSLYFISTTDNRQQLREYIKTDNLNVTGVDLNISTPTYLTQPIKKLVVDGLLGYVLCCTADNTIYLYNYKDDGAKRVQSAWSTWNILNGLTTTSYEYYQLASTLLVLCKTATDYRYHQMQLDWNYQDLNTDVTYGGETYNYESKIVLPDYYPKLTEIRTPLNKVLIKKVTIGGEGQFDAEVYRKDYDTTYTKTHDQSLADLDLHVSSKVGNVVITIKDSSVNDFKIDSVTLEGLYNTTSREMR